LFFQVLHKCSTEIQNCMDNISLHNIKRCTAKNQGMCMWSGFIWLRQRPVVSSSNMVMNLSVP
jgi:hypothetical protein